MLSAEDRDTKCYMRSARGLVRKGRHQSLYLELKAKALLAEFPELSSMEADNNSTIRALAASERSRREALTGHDKIRHLRARNAAREWLAEKLPLASEEEQARAFANEGKPRRRKTVDVER